MTQINAVEAPIINSPCRRHSRLTSSAWQDSMSTNKSTAAVFLRSRMLRIVTYTAPTIALSACGGGDRLGVSPFACVQNGTCGDGNTTAAGSTSIAIGSTGTPPPSCVPVAIPADSSTTTCASFCFQEDAQAYYRAFNAFQLDGNDQDGIACEHQRRVISRCQKTSIKSKT